MSPVRERYGEAFWRAHHEAWVQSELNQREYCELYGVPLKAFGNWRAKFKAAPQTPARKVLYRRGKLSHTLSHGLSHGLSHDLPGPGPINPPARDGHRRRFSAADKRQILEEAIRPDARFSEVVPTANQIRAYWWCSKSNPDVLMMQSAHVRRSFPDIPGCARARRVRMAAAFRGFPPGPSRPVPRAIRRRRRIPVRERPPRSSRARVPRGFPRGRISRLRSGREVEIRAGELHKADTIVRL
jgi:hypothetical protein